MTIVAGEIERSDIRSPKAAAREDGGAMRAVLVVMFGIMAAAPSSAVVVSKHRCDARGRVVIADQALTTGAGHAAIFLDDRADNRAAVDVNVVSRVGWLAANTTLKQGQSVISEDGDFRLTMQRDGDVVLFDRKGRRLWATDTAGRIGYKLSMNGSGDLVVYTENYNPIWSAGTQGNFGASLAIQGYGNVVIYRGSTAMRFTEVCHDCN